MSSRGRGTKTGAAGCFRRRSPARSTAGSRAPRDLATLLNQQARAGSLLGRENANITINHTPSEAVPANSAPAAQTGLVHLPRRGIFYASELRHHKDAREFDREFGSIERACVIRFPPEFAAILRGRLSAHLSSQSLASGELDGESFLGEKEAMEPNLAGAELGLTITPTARDDYRLFDVEIERVLGVPNSIVCLTGILVELPCLLEAYKSLEGELLFKSNDISQMLYVYDAAKSPSLNISKLRDQNCWEWHAGLTPGTHRIRTRKFRNFRVFERSDVTTAEREICDILGQRHMKETSTLEACTEDVLEEQLSAILTNSLPTEITAVIGPDNPVLKAVTKGLSPIAVDSSDMLASSDDSLLRHLSWNAESFRQSLSERLLFSSDPSAQIDENDLIKDDLSERLFGEFENEEDELEMTEELLLENMGSNIDAKSSESSPSSGDEVRVKREKRKKRKLSGSVTGK